MGFYMNLKLGSCWENMTKKPNKKKVKVYGETQKAIKEGWLMDVGKVEEIN